MSGGGGGVSVGGGGGGGMGGGGGQGGGLCVFTCSSVLSAFGAVAALYDFDLGAESAFFAVNGLGALCFAKCQYLRLAQEKNRQQNNKYMVRTDEMDEWNGGGEGPLIGSLNSFTGGASDYGAAHRRRREDRLEDMALVKKSSKSKTKKVTRRKLRWEQFLKNLQMDKNKSCSIS